MDYNEVFDEAQRFVIFDEITSIIETANEHVEILKLKEAEKIQNESMVNSDFPNVSKSGQNTIDEVIKPEETDRPILVKYFNQLNARLPEINHKNRILCSAISEYFAQKKMEKPFYDLTSLEILNYTQRYQKSLEDVYKLKQERDIFIENAKNEKIKVLKEKDKAMEIRNGYKRDFHETIEATAQQLEASGQPVSEKFITRLINRFQRVHNEMSNVRVEFIKTQNSFKELIEKDQRLDDLGHGFKMFDFENLKTELQTITSNIDSKNEDLEKLRMRYRTNNQQLQKFQDNRLEIEEEIQEQSKILNELKIVEENLLKKNNKMKKLKENLKIELMELNQKAQLLTKTKLMLQYDKMEGDIESTNLEYSKIDMENQKLDMKILEYENKLKSSIDQKAAGKVDTKKDVEMSLYEQKLLKKKLNSDCLKIIVKS